MKNLLFFASFFVFLAAKSQQQYSFIKYSLDEGLPQSQVTQITQDKNGFLWIGTLGGLSRFSGKKFVNYSVESGLANNRISFLGFIRDTLWVGHEKGISKQFGKKFITIPTPEIEGGVKVTDILLFKNQKIVATNGNGLFVLKNKQLQAINPVFSDTLPALKAFNIIRDLTVAGNKLFIGTRLGLFFTKDLIHFKLITESAFFSISEMGISKKGMLYFSTYGKGVLSWSQKSGIKQIKLCSLNISHISKDFFIDHKGEIWATVKNNGVVRTNGKDFLMLNTKSGLPIDNISCVYEDKENNIWLGTEGKGLLRFAGEAFVYYNKKSGLSGDLVMSITQDRYSNHWFSTYASGITKMLPNKSTQYYNAGAASVNHTVWCSLEDNKGNMWFGTSAGISVFAKGKENFYTTLTSPEMPGNKISALFQDSKGRVWIGGKSGVSYFENGKFHRVASPRFKIENARCFAEQKGKLYFVAQAGLFVVASDNKVKFIKISDNQPTAYSVAIDCTGRVWVGTEEGLYYLKDHQLLRFNFSAANSSNFINFITPQQKHLWIGTNNGVFKLNTLAEIHKIKINQYGKQDGLVSIETNLNSGYIDDKGVFWFGTAGGLMRYNAIKRQKDSNVPPNILFKGLKVNFETINIASFSKKSTSNGVPVQLEFPYSKKHLTFQFIGITLTNPDKMKFRYKLEGFDESWSPEMNASEIVYSNLPAGDYVVLAKMKSENKQTSRVLRIPFTINPPFYGTWWFIIICSIAVVLIVYGVFFLRIKQIHRKQATERLVYTSKLRTLEQQSLNASMNRHFIFNALNSIQFFINTKNRLSANRYLSQFAKLIRQNLDSSTSENNATPLDQEIERLKLYLSIESMRFPDKFDYFFEIDPNIDPEKINVPSMIFQPFIENSIIHGILPNKDKKGKIDFKVTSIDENVLEFSIEDNGIGYENSMKKKLPSGDHQSQGMTITSSRIELLKKISGKEFQLIGPKNKWNSAGESIGTTVKIIISSNFLDY